MRHALCDLTWSFEDPAMRGWSGGALKNIKFHALSLRVSGVGCQVSGKKNNRQSVHGTLHTIELGDNLYQVLVNYGVKVREVGGLIAAWRNSGTYICT